MSGQATERFGVESAPHGLVLIQDLINSAVTNPSASLEDLLASAPAAQAWADDAIRRWSAAAGEPGFEVAIRERDAASLRELREALRAFLVDRDLGAHALPSGRVEFQLGGLRPSYGPTAPGWRAIAAIVAAELFLGDRLGTLARLKVCANPDCGSVFYDRSRNASRVWHDVDTCGNAANLRAYRARQKQAGR